MTKIDEDARTIAHIHERRSDRGCVCVVEADRDLHSVLCTKLTDDINELIETYDASKAAPVDMVYEERVGWMARKFATAARLHPWDDLQETRRDSFMETARAVLAALNIDGQTKASTAEPLFLCKLCGKQLSIFKFTDCNRDDCPLPEGDREGGDGY